MRLVRPGALPGQGLRPPAGSRPAARLYGLATMDVLPRLILPPLPPKGRDPLRHLTRDELRARVTVLEVENLMLARQVEFQAEELRCAAARERHAAKRKSQLE